MRSRETRRDRTPDRTESSREPESGEDSTDYSKRRWMAADSSRAPPFATPGTSGHASSPRSRSALSAHLAAGLRDPVALALGRSSGPSSGSSRGRRGRGKSSAGVITIQSLGNGICPFPERLLLRLPYETQFNVSNAVPGVPSYNSYKLNSLFHPGGTTPPLLPAWFDNVGAMYNYWRVHASTVSVDYIGNINSVDQYCGIWPSATGSIGSAYAPVTVSGLRSFPQAKYTVIQAQAGLARGSKVNLTYHCNVMKTFGMDMAGSALSEGAFPSAPSGAADISLSETYFWMLGFFGSDFAVVPSTGINVDVAFKCIYYVECFGMMKPDNLTLSDIEQIMIDSQGAITLAPPADQPESIEFVPATAATDDDFMTDSVFIKKLKAKLTG